MYLQDFLGDKYAVVEKAMLHPALNPKRNPNLDQALKAVVSEVEQTAVRNIADIIAPLLEDALEMYVMLNGEHTEGMDRSELAEWESGLDDQVEEIMQPYEQHLSADWLGRNTIDTQLFEEGTPRKLAESAGREIVKQLSSLSVKEMEEQKGAVTKTPAQVLANAGITQADVQLYLDQHLAPKTAEEKQAMAENEDQNVQDVIAKIKLHVGSGFDMMEVFADIELMLDDDEILANGAGERLGLKADDVQVLQTLLFVHDATDVPNIIMSALDDTPDPSKGAKGGKAAKEPKAAPAMGEEAAEVLDLLVAHSAVNDTKLAADIGVSRATFNNYKARKTQFAPDEVQKGILRGQIVQDLNGLYRALCLIDNVDIDRDFE